MKTKTIRWVIVIFLLLPFTTILLPYVGPPHFRLHERNEAFREYTSNPSASTKAALTDELMRLEHHRNRMVFIALSSVLAIDVVVVYFYWNYRIRKKQPPNTLQPTATAP